MDSGIPIRRMASYHPWMENFGLDILVESHAEIYIVLQAVAFRAEFLPDVHLACCCILLESNYEYFQCDQYISLSASRQFTPPFPISATVHPMRQHPLCKLTNSPHEHHRHTPFKRHFISALATACWIPTPKLEMGGHIICVN